ncbi:aldose 1-epimerase [Bosea caraganae]|nr:aldose 1-epimerase [Bosea caraganae]
MRATLRPRDGGRIASLWREEPNGRRTDVLVPMPEAAFDPAYWPKAGSYPLAPFSNRIRDAAFRFGEARVALVPHPAAAPHAQHGFSQMRPWTVTQETGTAIEMRYRHEPDEWPWAFEAVQRIALDPSGLTHEIAVESLADTAMPVGLGIHPYFAVSQGDRIRFNADALWEQDADGCGRQLVPLAGSAGHYDSRHAGKAATIYYAGWDGVASIHRQDGTRILIQSAAPLDHFVFHVPAGGGYLCLEPVSHVADAFNLAAAGHSGTGMRVLNPNEAISAKVRIGLA